MVEIITLLLIVVVCLIAGVNRILYLLLLLLPFHSFIKNLFEKYSGGGFLFASWKEIAVLILLYKVFMEYPIRFNRYLWGWLFLFAGIVGIYFLKAPFKSDALATLRDHIFPVLLFIALANFPVTKSVARNIIIIFCVSASFVVIGGLLQNFFFKIPVGFLMHRIDFIDAAGYIKYNSTSARIMGFERMAGIIGGPNDFGLTVAFFVCVLGGIVLTNLRNRVGANFVRLAYALLVAAFICLLFSFSRAGWAITLVAFIIIYRINKIRLPVKFLVIALLAAIVLVGILSLAFPYVGDILSNTFTGKEASAADRGHNFAHGLQKNLSEPFGHGLGSADQARTGRAQFYAESAFLNINYEAGIFGLICLIGLHLKIILEVIKVRKIFGNPFSSIAVAISIATLITCFVSVNPYGMPFIFYWWLILGLGLNRSAMNGDVPEKEPQSTPKPALT
jgi:O-Antigen ligase